MPSQINNPMTTASDYKEALYRILYAEEKCAGGLQYYEWERVGLLAMPNIIQIRAEYEVWKKSWTDRNADMGQAGSTAYPPPDAPVAGLFNNTGGDKTYTA